MIGAWLPQGVLSLHAVEARQGVHDGVLERMPHVQGARDIGRRDHDAIRITTARGDEVPVLFPGLVPTGFNVLGGVSFIHFLIHTCRGGPDWGG